MDIDITLLLWILVGILTIYTLIDVFNRSEPDDDDDEFVFPRDVADELLLERQTAGQSIHSKRGELQMRVVRARAFLRNGTDEDLMQFDPRIRELYEDLRAADRAVFTRELERVVAAGDPPQKSEPIKPEPPVPATAAPDLWVPNTDIPADRWFVEKEG